MIKNRWNPTDAATSKTLLEQRVYSSRLLGQDPGLVMHGGGNTSVKDEVADVFGAPEKVLFIKGSGWDLGTIEKRGFPAVKLNRLLQLRRLETLGDTAMMNELRTSLVDSRSPDPSVEALLHAFLPHRFIDHTHADAVLTLTNQPDGETRVREIYGNRVAIVPYAMPGFQLAKLCAAEFEKNPAVEGMILLKHGIFTFGETAEASYLRMINLVQQAEEYIDGEIGGGVSAFGIKNEQWKAFWMQTIRTECLRRKFPCVLNLNGGREALNFVNHPNAGVFSQRGTLTPDHIIRTKRVPLYLEPRIVQERSAKELSRRFDEYAREYDDYFARNGEGKGGELQKLDPLPRVVLLPGIGVVTLGSTAKDASIAADIYSHTLTAIINAEQMSGYEALPESDLFDVEYWVLEQAKLKLGSKKLPLSGRVAVVTGAASGIGLAIAKEFLEKGAVVFILDVNADKFTALGEELRAHIKGGAAFHCLTADVSSRDAVAHAITQTVELAGGIDILVLNAGVFTASFLIEETPLEIWNQSLRVNLDGAFNCLAESLKWMKAQGQGGDILFVASKNSTAPGKGAAAYSVAKAGQTQLARVCALEAAPHGIRVNVLHPHLILDTEIWSDSTLNERAKAYGMSVEEYKTNNLLKTSLTSADVAKAAMAFVSGAFSKTTGCQVPVDGGSDRTL